MKPWIRNTLIAAAAVLAAAASILAWSLHRADARMTRTVAVPARTVALRDDFAAVERGEYLYRSRGCADCHGGDGGGRVFVDDAKMGLRLAGPNISPGAGSVVKGYGAADWDRTVRHGVKPDGRPLMIMPSQEFARWTDADLAAIVAYVRQLPPARGGAAVLELPVPVRAMYGLRLVMDAAETIDHSLPPPPPVPEGVTVEHGRYVGQGCTGCHGEGLSGGRMPGAPPDWPAAANLTPGEGSALPRYASAQAFMTMLKTGKRPDGSPVSKVMPFQALAEMNDVDAQALFVYLKSLPPRPAGQH